VIVRDADRRDLARVAALHADRIAEGFLPRLGRPFLERLYRRVLLRPDAFVIVAADDDRTVGFVAVAADLGALYRSFVVRDGAVAGLRAAPRILASLKRVLETLRYPASERDLPDAEILAVAVEASAAGRGVGRALVDAATARMEALGVRAVKVVTAADNVPALGLYRSCGFTTRARVEVHGGTPSEVLVWTAS